MKPRSKPGKVGTSGRAARMAIQKAKPLSNSQMEHLKPKKVSNASSSKAGRKGKRASWDIDFEEGFQLDTQPMPHREPESFTIEGVRRWPKRGH